MSNPTNAEQAMALFDEEYADFIVSFDVQEFWQIIGDELRIRGVSERTRSDFSVRNLFRDTETYCLDLLERGALARIQRFGLTKEGEDQLAKMQARVKGIPRGSVRGTGDARLDPVAPGTQAVSRWANLTRQEFDAMSSQQAKQLYRSDLEFRAAVDRLPVSDVMRDTRHLDKKRVYLRRIPDLHYFAGWKNGEALWTPDSYSWAHMDYPEGSRIIGLLKGRGIVVNAYDTSDHQPVDVSTKQAERKTEKRPELWRVEASGIETVHARPASVSRFILKTSNHEFVYAIDEAGKLIRTVRQPAIAKSFSTKELPTQIARSIENIPFVLCRGNGEQVPW